MREFESQKEKVLWMLFCAGRKGVSSKTFYQEFLPRASARIYDLREDGYTIIAKPDGKYKRYILLDEV